MLHVAQCSTCSPSILDDFYQQKWNMKSFGWHHSSTLTFGNFEKPLASAAFVKPRWLEHIGATATRSATAGDVSSFVRGSQTKTFTVFATGEGEHSIFCSSIIFLFIVCMYIYIYIIKGSLDEKLPSYEVLKMLRE